MLKHQPTLLVSVASAALLNTAVQCALCALTFRHRTANRTVLRFFEELLALALPHSIANPTPHPQQATMLPILQSLVGSAGPQIAQACIAGAGGVLHYTHVAEDNGSITGALRVLVLLCGETMRPTISAALDVANTRGCLVPEGKELFLNDLFTYTTATAEFSWRNSMCNIAQTLQPHLNIEEGEGEVRVDLT